MINFTLWKNYILLEVVSRDMDGFDDQEMMPIVFSAFKLCSQWNVDQGSENVNYILWL